MTRVIFAALFVLALSSAFAEPITSDRISKLPSAEQPAWQAYLQRSAALAKADQAALDAEVKASGMTAALQAPDGGDFKLPAKPGEPYFSSDEAKTLADVLLSY